MLAWLPSKVFTLVSNDRIVTLRFSIVVERPAIEASKLEVLFSTIEALLKRSGRAKAIWGFDGADPTGANEPGGLGLKGTSAPA